MMNMGVRRALWLILKKEFLGSDNDKKHGTQGRFYAEADVEAATHTDGFEAQRMCVYFCTEDIATKASYLLHHSM
jgi:hypothetical protein